MENGDFFWVRKDLPAGLVLFVWLFTNDNKKKQDPKKITIFQAIHPKKSKSLICSQNFDLPKFFESQSIHRR